MEAFGIVSVKFDGEQILVEGNCKFNPGLPKRESKIGLDKVHGYTEKPQTSYIEFDASDRSDLEIKKLLSAKDATVTLEQKNGKIYVWREAIQTGEGEVEPETGKITVRFESADEAEEVR